MIPSASIEQPVLRSFSTDAGVTPTARMPTSCSGVNGFADAGATALSALLAAAAEVDDVVTVSAAAEATTGWTHAFASGRAVAEKAASGTVTAASTTPLLSTPLAPAGPPRSPTSTTRGIRQFH